LLVAVVGLPAAGHAAVAAPTRPLADLTLEELGNVVIESVSRRSQSLLRASASIYVIAGDEIRRWGYTTLAEALRLAPNLQVAAIDARQYAVSARGFNGNVSNKLLVMIDGRTVYSPLFSGVFWDAQDFVPADIDRIEVISGPAGVTWGTNAVNGVINVVTLPAGGHPGPSAWLHAGSRERLALGRYEAALSEGLAVRAYAKTFSRDASRLIGGTDVGDASDGTSAGFRADWRSGRDSVTAIGGLYRSGTDARPVFGPVDLRGSNLTAKWSRSLSATADFDVQAYVDHTRREDRFLLQEEAHLVDLEAKLRAQIGAHRWLVGAGHRRADDTSKPGLIFAFIPPDRRLRWTSAFVQDEVSLSERVVLTAGLRMEHNSYTGWESLPSLRLGYALSERSHVWGALSRAVRSPARFDREIFAPPSPPFLIAGGPDFVSEIANVAEIGYRTQPGANASFSVTGFVHDYRRLRSGEIVGNALVIQNRIEGQMRGVEAWGRWNALARWRLEAGLLWLENRLHRSEGSTDPVGPSNLGNDPRLQWSLRSIHNLGERLDAAVALRHVDRLPFPAIPSYTAADLVVNWQAHPTLRLSAGVRNAFDGGHAEYQGFSTVSEIPRSAFVSLTYQPR
jgi:iron complex outermembrane receptor protein